ncbi:MAG: AMP-binding protein, partial [Rhodospirillaceae bacterium]|nr:AMP-binding protein [Rhodospirillaceae bacterium]
MDDAFLDALEGRDPEEREQTVMAALPGLIRHVLEHAPGYRRLYGDVDPGAIASRSALAGLPVLRKSDLPELQAGDPPLGGLATRPAGGMLRLFASPGPIFEAEGSDADPWRSARALHATGFRAGDILQNCFSYHFTPAGVMFESGAKRIGCAVIPAGVGNSDQQARVMAALKPKGYVGTPDFLKAILEKADELGLDCSASGLAHVTGGPYLPALRAFYEGRGIQVFQSYGIADLGIIAYETVAREGLVVDEGAIVEIVAPGTGDPVPDGDVGEVLVTVFTRDYPLIRFATGDLSAVLPGPSPCGRTN